MVWGNAQNLLALILSLKNQIVLAMEVNFLEKLPQLVALWIFQSSYLSHGESLNHNIFFSKHTFENITYTLHKSPKLVTKILATNFGFVPDW